MTGGELNIKNEKLHQVVKTKLSKIQFPEVCPVCMDEAEDLVPITILESSVDTWTERRGLRSGWAKEQTAFDHTISASQGGTTFWVPTCLAHGSDTVTTPRKKVISIVGFMLLFYPLLYYVLGLIAAIQYSRPIPEVLVPVILISIAMIIDLAYGFYPRALEKSIRFLQVNLGKDEVIITLENEEYRQSFLHLNEMFATSLQRESTKTEET